MIGISVLTGFLTMLLIDELCQVFVFQSSGTKEAEEGQDNKASLLPHGHSHEEQRKSSFVVTVGLCVHSVAEGVAMGAS